MDVRRVIEYLSTGETLLLAGAGVAAELGLPTWGDLTRRLIDDLPTSVAGGKHEVEALAAAGKYPEAMGWIERHVGREFLIQKASSLTRDNGATGELNRIIATLNFKSVFTTNFDSSLARHFRLAGNVLVERGNSPQELNRVDIDMVPCFVKLHSDFAHPQTLILTDVEYADARSSDGYRYLRTFLRQYLATKRFIFIGYSISDPDIQLVLEDIARNSRRPDVPVLAILADVAPDQAQRLSAIHNVDVVTYENRSRTHRELVSFMTAMTPFIGRGVRTRALDADIRRAQSLYLWSRLGLAAEAPPFQVDALKSILLSLLAAPTARTQLIAATLDVVGVGAAAATQVIERALASLIVEGDVTDVDGTLRLTARAQQLVGDAASQHRDVADAFRAQVTADLAAAWPDVEPDIRSQAELEVLEAVVDVFSERGLELASTVVGRTGMTARGSANLFALLVKRGERLGSDDLKYRFVRYVAGLLTDPKNAQLAYLEHLALAFFSLQALSMDPDGYKFREEYLQGRELLVDSNVLIPYLALELETQPDHAAVMQLARDARIPLLTTPGVLLEVLQHAQWARAHVARYGAKSMQVMQAVEGRGYKRNAFLAGYVRFCVRQREVELSDYLAACVGGPSFTLASMREFLAQRAGIETVDVEALQERRPEFASDQAATEAFIREQAEERLVEKADSRMAVEAELFEVLRARLDEKADPGRLSVGLLSSGAFLNKVAQTAPNAIHRNVVVAPDALYAFLVKTGKRPAKGSSFRELMLSTVFDTSNHFVDRQAYADYFAPIIREAESTYQQHLQTFHDEVDNQLTDATVDELDPLDRPLFMASLQARLEFAVREKESRAVQAEAQNRELTARLSAAERELRRLNKQERNIASAKARKERKAIERRNRKRRTGR